MAELREITSASSCSPALSFDIISVFCVCRDSSFSVSCRREAIASSARFVCASIFCPRADTASLYFASNAEISSVFCFNTCWINMTLSDSALVSAVASFNFSARESRSLLKLDEKPSHSFNSVTSLFRSFVTASKLVPTSLSLFSRSTIIVT